MVILGIGETIWIIRALFSPAIRNRCAAVEPLTTPRKKGSREWRPGPTIRFRARHRPDMDSGTTILQLNLYYVGTGKSESGTREQSRKGDNLYTCSIIALIPTPEDGLVLPGFTP